jgi:hypothetical protein
MGDTGERLFNMMEHVLIAKLWRMLPWGQVQATMKTMALSAHSPLA